MDDEHPRVGGVLVHHVAEEDRPLLRRGPCAERLLDREDCGAGGEGEDGRGRESG